jgi:hypothetical protein
LPSKKAICHSKQERQATGGHFNVYYHDASQATIALDEEQRPFTASPIN